MKPSLTLVLVSLLLSTSIAGCFQTDKDPVDPAIPPPEDPLTLHPAGGFTLQMPVDVILIGFEPGTQDALEKKLTPEEIRHAWASYEGFREWPLIGLPYGFEAHYNVTATSEAFADKFWDFVEDHEVSSREPDVYDANAAEDYLAEHLPDEDIELEPGRPTLAVLHANGALAQEYGWHLELPNGSLEPVRHFGETTSLTVHDMSARPDPYVGAPTSNLLTINRALEQKPRPYNEPTPAGGPEAVEALELYVRDATHHRVLQGVAYPVSTQPCHDVSILMAVDTATLSGRAPGWRAAETWLDADALEDAFVELTDDDVRVTVQWVELPQEDPELAALTRSAAYFVPTWDPLYTYLMENWNRFTDARPGCEAYLSMIYWGDFVGGAHANGGFAIYDADHQRRISYSAFQDMGRLIYGIYEETIPGRNYQDHLNRQISHETGHLLGLLHPQNVYTPDGGHVMNAVESIHSTMSYQTGDRTHGFSVIDQATWQRNRAGFALWQAQELGLENTPAFQEAADAMRSYDWPGVQVALEPYIQSASHLIGEDDGGPYVTVKTHEEGGGR